MGAGAEKIVLRDEVQEITYYTRKGGKKPIIYAYFTIAGKRYRFSTKTTDIKQASIIAHQKYRFAFEGKEVKIRSLRQVGNEFLKYKKTRISKATYENYSVILEYVYQFMGDTDITKINNKTIKELEYFRRNYYKLHPKKRQQKYKRNGKVVKGGRKFKDNISNRTINLTIGLAMSVMRYGADNGYINESDIPKWNKLKEGRRDSWLNESDFLKIYRYYEKHNTFYAYIVGFLFYTGIRPVEMNRLKWKEVNFDRKVVLVKGRKHKSRIVDSVVPLFPRTVEILNRLREQNKKAGVSVDANDFVFVNESGRQVKSIRKSFSVVVKKLGLDNNLCVFSLRHGFATYLIEKYDVPLIMISKIMGHSDTKMLEKVYQHLRDDTVVERVLKEHERSKESGKIIETLT